MHAALLAVFLSLPSVNPAAAASAPEPRLAAAAYLGLRPGSSDLWFEERREGEGTRVIELGPAVSGRINRFLSTLPPEGWDQALALALRGFLEPRMDPRDLENNEFLRRDAEGRLQLTALGRGVLVDILSAEDGQALEAAAARPAWLGAQGPGSELAPVSFPGAPAPAGLALGFHEDGLEARRLAMLEPGAAFDGTRHRLGDFDWSALETLSAPAAEPGSLQAAGAAPLPPGLEGYAVDRERNTVRVMVAAQRPVSRDRLSIPFPEFEAGAVYEEAGLDGELFERHGARVVNALDNLVTVDVSLEEAAALGQALQAQGLESRPARVFHAVRSGFEGPAAGLLGLTLLPFPPAAGALAALLPQGGVEPQLAGSRDLLGAGALHQAGLRGRGTVVGIIDSGIDPAHPDFQDASGASRVQAFRDFTGEGSSDDVVGHGTHVAGGIGGTGAASQGRYQGLAPETRFRVARVLGRSGRSDESVILAAMRWMRGEDDPAARVDVLNLSLSGPVANLAQPNLDPLSSMANQLVARDNILVVAAAGNHGVRGRGSVASPGNARYALTVTGVTHEGGFPFFASQGPVRDPEQEFYNKPDVAAVAGDINLALLEAQLRQRAGGDAPPPPPAGLQCAGPGGSPGCIYAPGGVIAPRSSADPNTNCDLPGNPGYRYMSGTSMAAPMVAGMSADIIGYLRSQGVEADPFAVRALIMETARDLGQDREVQGAGLVQGEPLVRAVMDRVARGLPVGNVAYALSMRLTSADRQRLAGQSRYRLTPLGLLDAQEGRLVRDERELEAALLEIRRARPALLAGV